MEPEWSRCVYTPNQSLDELSSSQSGRASLPEGVLGRRTPGETPGRKAGLKTAPASRTQTGDMTFSAEGINLLKCADEAKT